MQRGRHICNTLKAVRRQIAEANDIKYEPHDCKHEGPCRGTCPACEAEVRYLERELELRRRLGRAVAVVGVSAGLATALSGCSSKKPAVDPVDPDDPTKFLLEGDVLAPEEPQMLMGKPAVPAEMLDRLDSAELKPVATTEDEKIFGDIDEQMPEFPGGDKALMDYIQQNLRNPDNRQGRVIVTFWVEPDGSLTGAGVVKSVAPELDREALRLVSTMPKWRPGKRNGEGVRVKYTLPVTFKPT